MESHPLNLAHQQHRRAEAHLINNRYDDAMQCHHNAAELLLDAMKSTNSSVAIESITLQHSYHLKQKDLIKSKKEQYARVKKAMDHLKYLGRDPVLQGNDHSKLQVAIYRAINETDVLLNTLSHKKELPPVKDVIDGKKTEKSQDTVVEELHILSQNLHSLVEQLVFQVEVLKDENGTLKERVNYLEKERVKYLNLPSNATNNLNTEGYAKESVPVAIIPAPNKANVTPIERLQQQPHFDLSALKDD
ncbi:hypothetical protein O0L34_g5483 [Tuta absoluta]|nr:hypothetical protein O0L34_g5483 [Tuta absoluta]